MNDINSQNKVIIAVHGGCASLVIAPKAIRVYVRDYDREGFDDGDLQKDADGCEYLETELE